MDKKESLNISTSDISTNISINQEIPSWPKISIVTPSFNQEKYIEETILSVLNQNYPNLEYIIIDGGSSDNSVEIIKKYEDKLSYWISEEDSGMYDALNKGFDRSTGEIMLYINSDDILQKGSLNTISHIFTRFENVDWITGYTCCINEKSEFISAELSKNWDITDYINNNYHWIQQESTVWRRSLWEKAGGKFNTNCRYAGDLELWSRFFLYSNLVTCDAFIGAFRFRQNQLSALHMEEYISESKAALKFMKKTCSTTLKRQAVQIKVLKKTIGGLKRTGVLDHRGLCNLLEKIILSIKGKNERIAFSTLKKEWIIYLDKKTLNYK